MIRNLKVLGLALGAVFAFAAISASSAMAETTTVASFTAGAYPATTTGTQDGANHKFSFLGGAAILECTSSHFDGVGTDTGPTTSATYTPTYSGCNTKLPGTKRTRPQSHTKAAPTHSQCTKKSPALEATNGKATST